MYEDIIEGRNAVTAALKSGRQIDKIYIRRGDNKGSLLPIIAKAKEKGISVVEIDKGKLDSMSVTHAHQGVVALAAVREYSSLDDILRIAEDRGEPPFVIVCDEISDPHNLGAIIRTAECAGAHGVIIPKHRSVSLTSTVAKSSAGALFRVAVARVANIASTVAELQSRGVWVYALEANGKPYFGERFDDSGIAFVLGSEGEGVSRIVKEKSDFVLSIPMYGELNSLNVSNAAAIMLFEAARQRHGKGE